MGSKANPKVLVVDDEEASLEILTMLLEARGYRVLTATDGQAALDVMASELPALVITDYMMPRINGLGLCRRMDEDENLLEIPVIFTTASHPDDIPAMPRIVAVFVKPLMFDRFLDKVDAVLEAQPAR